MCGLPHALVNGKIKPTCSEIPINDLSNTEIGKESDISGSIWFGLL